MAFLLIGVLLSGCYSSKKFDPALLRPSTTAVSPKLPHLTLRKAVRTTYYGDAIKGNSKMFTLFEREVPNLSDQYGTIKGTIEPVIIINESNTNYGWLWLSAFTLYTINLLGAPVASDTYQMEIEFIIRDSQQNIIWRKAYYEEDKIRYGLYKKVKRGDERRILIFKDMIRDLKRDLEVDRAKIVERLS